MRIKVMIADSEAECVRKCSEVFDDGDFELVSVVDNGKDCLDRLQREDIDVLILDLALAQIDGYGVMESLLTDYTRVPKVFVLSELKGESYVEKAMKLHASYYFYKPVNMDYVKKVVKREVLGDVSPKYAMSLNKESSNTLWKEENKSANSDKDIEEEMARIFISLGIPAHIKGYQFLRTAIKEVMAHPNMINSITKQLYPAVAKAYDTSSSKVERAIRHAIEVAWNRGKLENLNKLFGFKIYCVDEKPTNGEFIALLADKLMVEHAI